MPEFVGFATRPIVIFIYLMTINVPLVITLVTMVGCIAFMAGMMLRVTQAMANFNSVIIEYIGGMKLIKAYNMESKNMVMRETISMRRQSAALWNILQAFRRCGLII